MRTHTIIAITAFTVGSALAAGPLDDIKAAAKKLADSSGYSWKTTTELPRPGGGGAGPRMGGPVEGKAIKDGTIYIVMQRGDTTTEAYIKGEKGAVKTDQGWQSLSDMTAAGGGQGAPGRGRFLGRMLQNYKAPAAEVVELAEKVADLKKEGDVYTGNFTEEGAKALLAGPRRGGGQGPNISGAKGSLKVWIKDGLVSQYEYNLQGTMTFGGNDREVNRTVKVEIKDVGTTKFEVPPAAKEKMS